MKGVKIFDYKCLLSSQKDPTDRFTAMKLESTILRFSLQVNRYTERRFVYKMSYLFFGKIQFS
jgi:hypothetical protein